MRAPSRSEASLAHTTSSATRPQPAEVSKPQSVPASTRVGSPTVAATDHVEVKLADGRRLKSADVEFARGHWERPLSREALAAKFHDCADAELGEKGAQALFGELQALDRLTSLRDLRTAAELAA